jgi:hypothetical protein
VGGFRIEDHGGLLMYWVRAILLFTITIVGLNAAVVVVNREVTDTNISEERVRDFLLGRSTSWSSGDPVVIILCTDKSGELAVSEVTGRSVSLLQRAWKRLVFSGTGAMPLQADSVAAALIMVAKHPGAMVILSEEVVADRCRIIPLLSEKTLTSQ